MPDLPDELGRPGDQWFAGQCRMMSRHSAHVARAESELRMCAKDCQASAGAAMMSERSCESQGRDHATMPYPQRKMR
jgi:hypothetical protein